MSCKSEKCLTCEKRFVCETIKKGATLIYLMRMISGVKITPEQALEEATEQFVEFMKQRKENQENQES